MMDDVEKKMGDVVKKLDEIIEICRNVFAAILLLMPLPECQKGDLGYGSYHSKQEDRRVDAALVPCSRAPS
jgi:hypothetical protein